MTLMKLLMLGAFCAKTCLAAALAANGTILLSFPGASGPGYKPVPDTTGAVGLLGIRVIDTVRPTLHVVL